MSNRARGHLWISILMAAWSGIACAPPEDADLDEALTPAAQVRIVNVEVTPVIRGTFVDYIRLAGQVEAFEDVVISADEDGVIERYLVQRGDHVRPGQPLLKLDSDVLEAQVEEARASAALAQEQYERRRQLWEAERIGTEIAFLEAKYQADMASARLANLAARLDRTTIRAPLDGVLEEKFLEEGERAGVGDEILRVVTVTPIKVTAGVPERFAPFIHVGDRADVTFEVFGSRVFGGQINFVGTTVNPQNRTFPIEIVIANPDGVIKPQMIVNVQVVRERLDSVIVVPQTAVVRGSSGYQVFVVENDEQGLIAVTRPVTLGASYDNQVVVEAGIDVAESLITTGQQLVDAGTRVRVVDVGPPSTAGPEGAR